MNSTIQTQYDEGIKGYIIEMPSYISLASIQVWVEEFSGELNSVSSGQPLVMLINTNKHNFESIECLKVLRAFFTSNATLQSNGVKAAFVGPLSYIAPYQKSEFEAYFESSKEAYIWLQGKHDHNQA